MRQCRALVVAFCCSTAVAFILFGPAVARAAAPVDALPTQDEIHQLFERKQYPNVLQKIAKVLTLKGDAAKGYDRHDLLRLKAEAHLRLKAYPSAEQAFIAAAKEAPDEAKADVDLATSVLIHRSKGGQYQPNAKVRGRMPDAISVVDNLARKSALEAVFRDEMAADTPRIKSLRDTASLDALVDIAPTITTLRGLEIGATGGNDEEAQQLITTTAKRAQDLMGDMVQDMIVRVDTIIARAAARSGAEVTVGEPPDHALGVDAVDRKELNQIVAACEKIVPTARAFGDALGPPGKSLIMISVTARGVANKAVEVSR